VSGQSSSRVADWEEQQLRSPAGRSSSYVTGVEEAKRSSRVVVGEEQ
jgi:hypothetical protein